MVPGFLQSPSLTGCLAETLLQRNGGSDKELTALLNRAIDKRVKELLSEFSRLPENFKFDSTVQKLRRWAAANAYVPPPKELEL